MKWFASLFVLFLTTTCSFTQYPSWSYHKLTNGPQVVSSATKNGTPVVHLQPCCKCEPGITVYSPPNVSLESMQPRKIVLGWHYYRSPSPNSFIASPMRHSVIPTSVSVCPKSN